MDIFYNRFLKYYTNDVYETINVVFNINNLKNFKSPSKKQLNVGYFPNKSIILYIKSFKSSTSPKNQVKEPKNTVKKKHVLVKYLFINLYKRVNFVDNKSILNDFFGTVLLIFFWSRLKKNPSKSDSTDNFPKAIVNNFRKNKIYIKFRGNFLESLLFFFFQKKLLHFLNLKVFIKKLYNPIEEGNGVAFLNLFFKKSKISKNNSSKLRSRGNAYFFHKKIYFYFFHWRLKFDSEMVFLAQLFKKSMWVYKKIIYISRDFKISLKRDEKKPRYLSENHFTPFFTLKYGILVQKHPYSLIAKTRFLCKKLGSYESDKNKTVIKLLLNDVQFSSHLNLLTFLILFLDLIFSSPKIKNIISLTFFLQKQDFFNSIELFKIPQNMEKFLNFTFFKNLNSKKLLFQFITKNGLLDLYRKWLAKIIFYSNLRAQKYWFSEWLESELKNFSFCFFNKKNFLQQTYLPIYFFDSGSLYKLLFKIGRWDILFKILCIKQRFYTEFDKIGLYAKFKQK